MTLQLYLHFPFCKSKCLYCDFCSAPGSRAEMERYTAALCREIVQAGREYPGAEVSTVYLGGGTPSILPPDLMASVLESLRIAFSFQPNVEFSSEANPGTLTPEWLECVRRHGVNRLSMGVQAVQDELLRSLGRVHTFRQAEEAFQLAREAGFSRLSADLMFALPGQSLSDFRESIHRAAALGAEHISAYSLIVEEGTPLASRAASGAVRIPDEDEAADFYQLGLQELSCLGYQQYEISNFARPGAECLHNIGYWQGAYYLGLGVSAHSLLPARDEEKETGAFYIRASNFSNTADYCRAMEEKDTAAESRQPISRKEAMFEAMILGLRMNSGISGTDFQRRFGTSIRSVYEAPLEQAVQNGLGLWTADGGYRLTAKGLLLENAVAVELMDV